MERTIVVHGGHPVYAEASKDLGRRAVAALKGAGHEVWLQPYGPDLSAVLEAHSGGVYDATYGAYGRVELLTRLTSTRYLNRSGQLQAEAYDKVRLKTFLTEEGFGTPEYVVLDAHQGGTDVPFALLVGPDVVVKPARLDALSMGVARFDDAPRRLAEIREHVEGLFLLDSQIICERAEDGMEICVGFDSTESGIESFPSAGIADVSKFYGHTYKVNGNGGFILRDLTDEIQGEVERLGAAIAREFAIDGLFYINSFVQADGRLSTFDVGTTVGLSERSYFPLAAAAKGLGVEDLIWRTMRLSENGAVTRG